MQNVMQIATNAGHTAQNDGRTAQNDGQTTQNDGRTAQNDGCNTLNVCQGPKIDSNPYFDGKNDILWLSRLVKFMILLMLKFHKFSVTSFIRTILRFLPSAKSIYLKPKNT